jgi:hypothetical protein
MVIDAKEKGAKIRGAINMPLKQVIDMYCTKPVDIAEVIKNKKSTFDVAGLEQVKKYFTDCYDELERLKKKAKEAIGICESQIRIYKRNGQETKESEKNFKKISKINQVLIEQSIYLLLETFITAYSAQQISELYHFTDDEQADKIVTYEKSISIFQAIIDGVEFVRPLYDDMLETILTE